MHTNTERYNAVAIFLHWTLALLILLQIGVGLTMEDYPIRIRFTAVNLHKSIGLTVLGLSLFRLAWRLTHRVPPFPETMSRWEKRAAYMGHWAFYLLIIAMPLSGWIFVSGYAKYPTIFFGLGEIPHLPMPAGIDGKAVGAQAKWLHYWLAMGTLGLLVLHVGAALKHHFIEHDTVLRRMLPLWLQRRGTVVL